MIVALTSGQLQALREVATVAFSANTIGFSLTAGLRTHKLTDIVGTSSFLLATLKLSYMQYQNQNAWTYFQTQNKLTVIHAAVCLWALRLGSYLFYRVMVVGGDHRLDKFFPQTGERFFDKNRSNFPLRLGLFWFLQALWAIILLIPIALLNGLLLDLKDEKTIVQIANIFNGYSNGFFQYACIGGIFGGFLFEMIADIQKYRFRSNPSNNNKFISTGLWKLCRYPNYFGDLTFWWSTFLLSSFLLFKINRVINGSYLSLAFQIAFSLLSPLFISWLLLRVSGIPLHEASNSKKYKGRPDYEAYLKKTSLIIPWPQKNVVDKWE